MNISENNRVAAVLAAGFALVLAALAITNVGSATAAKQDKSASKKERAKGPGRLDEETRKKFAACMKENGVELPARKRGERRRGNRKRGERKKPSAEQRAAHRKAFEACREILPDGGARHRRGKLDSATHKKFAACMKKNGVELPARNRGSRKRGERKRGERKKPSAEQREAHRKAFEACKEILPDGGAHRGPRGPGHHGGPPANRG